MSIDDALESLQLFVVDQIRQAPTAEEKARLLLRLPDDLVLQVFNDLNKVCEASGFDLGKAYIDVRVSTMCATRQANGELPAPQLAQAEFYRGLLCSLGGVSA